MRQQKFGALRRIVVSCAVSTSFVMIGASADNAQAATWCPVSYLAQGSSEDVIGITVTATLNSARPGPTFDIYWHDSASGAIETTWTFSPAISAIQFETIAHADAGVEKYTFTAKAANDSVVDTFEIENLDGQFPYTFATPVATIEATYSPSSGPYGTYLKAFLQTELDTCDAPPPPPSMYFPEDYLERREAMLMDESALPDLR